MVRGDNLLAIASLLPRLAGKVGLVYADPPFAAGIPRTLRIAPGGSHPPLTPPAYDDRWQDLPAYLTMLQARLTAIRELLRPGGSLFLHLDHRADFAARLLLDEVFGPGCVLNRIVWHYTGGGRGKRWFSRKHDVILWAVKGGAPHVFNLDAVRVPYRPTSGYARGGIVSAAGKRYLPHPGGTPVDDVWEIPMVNPLSAERTGYPTQKPEALLERIILAASHPGDLVGDFFAGSGTTLAVAERLGRQWVGADHGAAAIRVARSRLLALGARREFRVCAVEGAPEPTPGVLRAALRLLSPGTLAVSLEGCVPPPGSSPLLPWPDLLSYWAVDWDHRDGVFTGRWWVSRGRRDRGLPLVSPPLPWDGKPRTVAVMAADPPGNEYVCRISLPGG
jgi:DNA modification methylase